MPVPFRMALQPDMLFGIRPAPGCHIDSMAGYGV